MSTQIITGDCLVRFDGRREQTVRGRVVVLLKPDNTVLVHDTDGYQPVAWLTRPEDLTLQRDPPRVVATDGDELLRVEAADDGATIHRIDATAAGDPAGDCRCGGPLVDSGGSVSCLDCSATFSVPHAAEIGAGTCGSCGLPTMSVDRGEAFEVCLDRACDSLDAAVADRFDGVWDCPNCEDGSLDVIRRGGLLAGCENYPECDTGFGIPTGVVDGTCGCGLPIFETASGRRCLDTSCELLGAIPE
ncbi:MAG: endonuclease NucS [Natronomonas sp.]